MTKHFDLNAQNVDDERQAYLADRWIAKQNLGLEERYERMQDATAWEIDCDEMRFVGDTGSLSIENDDEEVERLVANLELGWRLR